MGSIRCHNCGTVLADEASRASRACPLCGAVQQLGCRVCGTQIRPGATTCREHSAAVVGRDVQPAPRRGAGIVTVARPVLASPPVPRTPQALERGSQPEPPRPVPPLLIRAKEPSRRRRTTTAVAIAVALVVGAGVAFMVLGRETETVAKREQYSAVVRQRFLDRCTRAGGSPDACRCALDRGEELYTLEQFVRLERQLGRTGRLPGHEDVTGACSLQLTRSPTGDGPTGAGPAMPGPCPGLSWRTRSWGSDCSRVASGETALRD
jgi:hypothetical protein